MPKPPPFMRPLAVSIVVSQLKIVLPVAAIVAVMVGVSGVGIMFLEASIAPPAVDVQPGWQVDARGPVLASLGSSVLNELPPAVPLQRTPPNCDPDLERPLRGACWVPVDVSPCPKGKAYVNDKGPEADGKCYARGMKAARSPTSGDPRPPAIADP
jgi:hypothetical protein